MGIHTQTQTHTDKTRVAHKGTHIMHSYFQRVLGNLPVRSQNIVQHGSGGRGKPGFSKSPTGLSSPTWSFSFSQRSLYPRSQK